MRVTFSGTPDQVVSAARKLTTPEQAARDEAADNAFIEAIRTIMQADKPRKIVAIKLYRNYFQTSLVESKRAVERMTW